MSDNQQTFRASTNEFAKSAYIVGNGIDQLSVVTHRTFGQSDALVSMSRYDSGHGLVASVTDTFSLGDLRALAHWILEEL